MVTNLSFFAMDNTYERKIEDCWLLPCSFLGVFLFLLQQNMINYRSLQVIKKIMSQIFAFSGNNGGHMVAWAHFRPD